jgi:uncharacterized protein YecE (DUF72 family)
MKVFVGVSGFSYPSWIGKFYPEGLKSEEFLGYYSKLLDSVEINSSFYAAPSATMVKGWSAKTDQKFVFAFKAPRLITHILKLGKGAPEASAKLSAILSQLGPRFGPILFQLPPFSKLNHDSLEKFLSDTQDIKPKVFEFRHPSWFTDSTYRLLEEYGAGFCIADTEDLEPIFKITGRLAYFRLRKESYDSNAIEEWSEKIHQSLGGSDRCHVYLRHDETGENAVLAQALSKKLQPP